MALTMAAALEAMVALAPAQRHEVLAALPSEAQQILLDHVRYDWGLHAREKQLEPAGEWRWWRICAGRSFGKTLTGAQWVRKAAESGLVKWISICGPTAGTTYRDMISGPTGILTVSPPNFRPEWQPSRLQLLYPRHPVTGIRTRIAVLSADAPDRVRGSQHEILWCDEPSAWAKPGEAMANLDMGLRLGRSPRGLVTMTPKADEFTRDLVQGVRGPDGVRRLPDDVRVVRGSTFENDALADTVLNALKQQYEGTRLGRQELHAEILDRPERALFTSEVLEKSRVATVPQIMRTILAVDPSRSKFATGDMAGGCVVALCNDGHLYALADVSVRGTPLEWIRHFADVANRYRVDLVVYEENRLDGALVKAILRDVSTRGQKWEGRKASEDKGVRAEPVSAAMEEGRIHLAGRFPELEEQLLGFDPLVKHQQDDRFDAFVWACRELLGRERQPMRLV